MASKIEILTKVVRQIGDQIILSSMSQWDAYNKVRLD